MGQEPFKGANEPEVCARVLMAVAKRLYTRSGGVLTDLNQVILDIPHFGRSSDPLDMMSTAISSLATYSHEGMKIKTWTNHVVMRSRAGYSFRHCFYFAYKGTRRDSRVTNRGVISPRGKFGAETYQQTTIAMGAKDEQSSVDDSRSGLDYGNATEGSTLPPKVAQRRLRIARLGK